MTSPFWGAPDRLQRGSIGICSLATTPLAGGGPGTTIHGESSRSTYTCLTQENLRQVVSVSDWARGLQHVAFVEKAG
jgi:hypothetical protein